jgi:hypothetical protein
MLLQISAAVALRQRLLLLAQLHKAAIPKLFLSFSTVIPKTCSYS